jgi:hypothetical protein
MSLTYVTTAHINSSGSSLANVVSVNLNCNLLILIKQKESVLNELCQISDTIYFFLLSLMTEQR